MNVALIKKKDINREIDKFLASTEKILNTGTMLVNSDLLLSDSIQKILIDKNQSIYEKTIKPIVVKAAIEAECISAGSAEICLSATMDILSNLRKDKSPTNKKNIEKYITEKIEKIILMGKKLEKKDIKTIIESEIDSPDIQKILQDTLSLSGPTSSIFVDKANHRKTSVKKTYGYNFNIKPDISLLDGKKTWKRKNVKCAIIDGIVETVGEIHHLLEQASSEKFPIVVFARSFSQDVMSTIVYNFKRGTLDLFPVSVGFDENTLNILNDISMCTNSRLISSYTGDLISESVKDNFNQIDEITVSNSGILIKSVNQNEAIDNHIKYLKEKRDTAEAVGMYDLFDRRIRSLSSGNITVRVGTDTLFKNHGAIESIDKVLRLITTSISSGILNIEDDTQLKDFNNFNRTILSKRIIPTASLVIALKKSISVGFLVSEIGIMLINDQ